MTINTLHERLEQVIQDLVNDPTLELANETRTEDIPGWDSMTQINLMFALEQEFGVRFAGDDIFAFETFGDLKNFIAQQKGLGQMTARGR